MACSTLLLPPSPRWANGGEKACRRRRPRGGSAVRRWSPKLGRWDEPIALSRITSVRGWRAFAAGSSGSRSVGDAVGSHQCAMRSAMNRSLESSSRGCGASHEQGRLRAAGRAGCDARTRGRITRSSIDVVRGSRQAAPRAPRRARAPPLFQRACSTTHTTDMAHRLVTTQSTPRRADRWASFRPPHPPRRPPAPGASFPPPHAGHAPPAGSQEPASQPRRAASCECRRAARFHLPAARKIRRYASTLHISTAVSLVRERFQSSRPGCRPISR